MAANTNPISPIAPATSWNPTAITAANTAMDGTGTVGTIFTAGANGSRVNRIRVEHLGTNVATVMRFFINNGSSNTIPGNNVLAAEATIASNTLSQVAASVAVDVPIGIVLKPGYKINYTIGTAVAAGHAINCPDAGDY
jgi:hypothetical protein